MKGETFPVAKAQNCQHQLYGANSDAHARTPPWEDCPPWELPPKRVHGGGCTSSRFMCGGQSRVDGTQQDPGTEGEFVHMSRRKGRRYRRAAARQRKRQERCAALGGMKQVFSYRRLYQAGLKCCRNVRWKQSVQRFEARLFSGTAQRRSQLLKGSYRFSPYVHFMLCERGKIRPIDAPRITDRQLEKVYTQKVLLPLYLPSMIWNNGASLPGKGFAFSRQRLVSELHEHYRKYGCEGGIILADGQKFFPNADHAHILARHDRLILDEELRGFGDALIATIPGGVGMPLGVEPSQAEMIAYASAMDNYMKCQLRLKGYGHYMDDFYALVPPDRDYRDVLTIMRQQAARCGFRLNPCKTRYVPLTKPFRYCKAKYILTETGKVVVRANRKAVPRDRKKLRAFRKLVSAGMLCWEDLWTSVNGMLAYLKGYNEHGRVLELRRLFYRLFGFSCENIENFRKRALHDAVYHDQALQA